MKIGVSGFAWTSKLDQTHLDRFPDLRNNGIHGFEVPMFAPADLDAAAIRRASEANGLECTVCAILPPGINPISPDAAKRATARNHVIRCIETAAEMGAHQMGGPLYAPIGYLPGHRRTADEWDWAVEVFQGIGETLDRCKVNLGIEPVNRSETHFLNTAADTLAFCAAIGHPRVGILIDTFHANIEEKSIPGAVRTASSRLQHVHMSENDRGLLGSGHVEFSKLVAALREVRYDGFLMIEGFGYSGSEKNCLGALWGDLNITPEEIAFEGAAYVRGLLRLRPFL
jgi:D-psicose/D-tagatose/L-ribulose 3-epimerase